MTDGSHYPMGATGSFNDQIAEKARRTVCQHAVDTAEARELMLMLGIYPGQQTDDLTVGPAVLPTARRS